MKLLRPALIKFDDEQFTRLLIMIKQIVNQLENLNEQLTELQSTLTDIFSCLERLEFKTGG